MKVLFLGNSHTFYNDMPQIFANICKEKGKNVEVSMQAHGGVTYGWHYSQFTELRFALMHGNFDYIIMQQAAHSPCPSKEETLNDGIKIINLAKKFNVTPIQTIPWAEKRDPEHQKEMYEIYNELHNQTDVILNPVGNIFEDIFYNYPEIDMYWRDGEHASPYGSYAIALCTFATIFNESVVGVSSNSYNTYPVTDHAWEEVKNLFAQLATDPNNIEFQKELGAKYKEHISPVLDIEQAFFKLDIDKTSTIQKLVDRYALK